jgi:hypothetical protein
MTFRRFRSYFGGSQLDFLCTLNYGNKKAFLLILSIKNQSLIENSVSVKQISLKMKLALLVSIIFAFAVLPSFQEGISQHVINGEDAAIEDHPYMAHIYTTFLPTCGAAVLSQRSVLTVRFRLSISN